MTSTPNGLFFERDYELNLQSGNRETQAHFIQAMSEETESTPKQEVPKSFMERLRERCVL